MTKCLLLVRHISTSGESSFRVKRAYHIFVRVEIGKVEASFLRGAIIMMKRNSDKTFRAHLNIVSPRTAWRRLFLFIHPHVLMRFGLFVLPSRATDRMPANERNERS